MGGQSSCLWFSEGSVRVEDEDKGSSDEPKDPNIDGKGVEYMVGKKKV